MRNKIIALILTVVMATLALASCAGAYNYAEENLDDHVTFDAAAFKEALKAIEIADSDFTTDEATREKKVTEAILKTLASYAEKNGEQKKDGALGANDVLYYAYYTTYDVEKDGVTTTYYFDMGEMKTSDFSSATSTVKSKHNISLSQIDVDNKKADKLAVALKNAIAALEDKTVVPYKTNTTANTAITKTVDDKLVAAFNSIYVSYTREYTEGEGTTTEKALYEKIDLTNTEDALVKLLLDANTTAKIGKAVEVKNGETTAKSFDVTVGEKTYKYSNFQILFAVEEEGKELVTFEYSPYTKDESVEPNNLHTSAFKVAIPKDAKLTYHVYPVYYYQVSDINATSIIIEALAAKVTTTSLDVLGSEDYKNGDKTVKALVEELVKLQKDTSEDQSLKDLKKAYDDAAKIVKDAGTKATTEQKDAETAAKKAYDDAKKTAVAAKVAEILAATKADADPIADVVVKEYKKDIYHGLKETYDSEIIDKVGEAIWKLINNKVTIKTYPEALLKEAKDHLYNEYEYKFYNEKTSSSETAESNYTAYDGNFDSYLVAVTKASGIDGVDAKIEAEAKKAIEPLIKLYVVAKALAPDANAVMLDQLKANAESAGIYDADYEYNDALSAEKNEQAKKEAEDAAKKYQDYEYYCAEHFLFDDEAFKAYKDYYGQANYEQIESEYGETNIRAALQADRLFDYLLNTKLEKSDAEDEHAHAETVYENGKLAFYNIGYTIKADTDADADKDSADK